MLTTLVLYRWIDPGSEGRLHRQWCEQSAVGDLLGEDLTKPRSKLFETRVSRGDLLLAVGQAEHQKQERVEAHILVTYLAYCLQVTLQGKLRRSG